MAAKLSWSLFNEKVCLKPMDTSVSTNNLAVGSDVLRNTAHILEPLVALLMEHGVTYQQLAETLKTVFIKIAEREFAADERRLTDSHLAVTTGIHRKDIRRLREMMALPASQKRDEAPQSLTAAVFTHWLTDPNFCNQNGQPKILQRHGGEQSFEELVRSISKDVHPRTVLNELARLEMVVEDDEQVCLKVDAFVPNPDFTQMLDYLGANLHDHAAAATHNVLGKGPAFLEQSIFSNAIPPEAVEDIATLVRQEWKHLLKSAVPQVAHHEASYQQQYGAQPHSTSGTRIRFGMYFFAEKNS
jgi:hypothetical protein